MLPLPKQKYIIEPWETWGQKIKYVQYIKLHHIKTSDPMSQRNESERDPANMHE